MSTRMYLKRRQPVHSLLKTTTWSNSDYFTVNSPTYSVVLHTSNKFIDNKIDFKYPNHIVLIGYLLKYNPNYLTKRDTTPLIFNSAL